MKIDELQLENKRLLEAERRKEEEYRKLAKRILFLPILSLILALAELVFTVTWTNNAALGGLRPIHILLASLVSFLLFSIIAFLNNADKTEIGVKGYLQIEKTLLINEMPNIFQILSLLGFLNVLLKQLPIKIAATTIITFFLLIYLTSKRREMTSHHPRFKDTVNSSVTVWLSISLGIILAMIIYGLSSLISVQL